MQQSCYAESEGSHVFLWPPIVDCHGRFDRSKINRSSHSNASTRRLFCLAFLAIARISQTIPAGNSFHPHHYAFTAVFVSDRPICRSTYIGPTCLFKKFCIIYGENYAFNVAAPNIIYSMKSNYQLYFDCSTSAIF